VGYLAEAFVYTYLGICILTISGQWKAIIMAIMVAITLPLSRAVAVYILPLFYIILGRPFPMTSTETSICFYAGLIRGAIAFALSLQIQSPNKEFIRTVTLLLVLFTTMCGSVSLKAIMKNFQQKNQQEVRIGSGNSSDRPADKMQ
jgi:NhaP-type Na+/H+ or K+/H+ antiporter